MDAHGLPVKIIVTKGTTADCTQACKLIENIEADFLFADRGYDSDIIISKSEEMNMKAIIPPKKNRKVQPMIVTQSSSSASERSKIFKILTRGHGCP